MDTREEIALSNWSRESQYEFIRMASSPCDADLVSLNMLDQKTRMLPLSKPYLAIVGQLKSIGWLRIQFSGAESHNFAELQRVESINQVDLQDVDELPEGALETIARFKGLHKLSIFECQFDAPANALSNAKDLQELDIQPNGDLKFWCRGPDLSSLKSLRKLSVIGCRVPDSFLHQIPASLTSLKLCICDITPTGFDFLGDIEDLEQLELDFSWTECQSGSLKSLGNLTRLRLLKVTSYPVTWDSTFEFLQSVNDLHLIFYGQPDKERIKALREMRGDKPTKLQFFLCGEDLQDIE